MYVWGRVKAFMPFVVVDSRRFLLPASALKDHALLQGKGLLRSLVEHWDRQKKGER